MAKGHCRILGTAREQQSQRTPDSDTAPDDHDVRAVDCDVVATQQFDNAARGARKWSLGAEHQAAEVGGVQTVGVLVRIHQLEHRVRIEVLGQRQLHDVARDRGVSIEFRDLGVDRSLGGVSRHVDANGGDAHLGAVLVLATHVGVTAGVIAHQHGAQAREDALRIEGSHANGELGLHGSGSGFSIKNRRGHSRILPCRLR